MKRIILIAVLIIIIAGGFIVYRMYDERTPDVVNKTPDERVEATALIAAFDQDSATARKKYLDKIVEVTGYVKRVDTTGSVILGSEDSGSEVVAGLDRRHIKDHEKIKPGMVAIVQGVCSGFTISGGEDLLASLGTTVELRSAGIKEKK